MLVFPDVNRVRLAFNRNSESCLSRASAFLLSAITVRVFVQLNISSRNRSDTLASWIFADVEFRIYRGIALDAQSTYIKRSLIGNSPAAIVPTTLSSLRPYIDRP